MIKAINKLVPPPPLPRPHLITRNIYVAGLYTNLCGDAGASDGVSGVPVDLSQAISRAAAEHEAETSNKNGKWNDIWVGFPRGTN